MSGALALAGILALNPLPAPARAPDAGPSPTELANAVIEAARRYAPAGVSVLIAANGHFGETSSYEERELRHALATQVTPTLRGASGKVRVALLEPLASGVSELEAPIDTRAGIYVTADTADPISFAFITLRAFREKRGDRMGTYRMGWWPAEFHRASSPAYANPLGFIEVGPETQNLRVSEHFRIRDFITHDQAAVWPKYVVLREEVLDKLELVLADLAVRGIPSRRPVVLSGFRTPLHNQYGLGGESGATQSRHQYGDAVDLIIDDNGDRRMDDLNRDGRLDARDVDVVLDAVERVERRYPALVGGVGRYHAVGPSGPFVHIDVRGYRARWSNTSPAQRVASAAPFGKNPSQPETNRTLTPTGSCSATGPFAVLCGR